MSYTKLEKILGGILYYKLLGHGEKSGFKGGLFAPSNGIKSGTNHITSVIRQLSQTDIDTPVTLNLIAQDVINGSTHPRTIQILSQWVDRAKPETVVQAFREFAQSLNVDQALRAKPVYQIFLKKVSNPWNTEQSDLMGFAVIPYFYATDKTFSRLLPANPQELTAYQRVAKYLKYATDDERIDDTLKSDQMSLNLARQQNLIQALKNEWAYLHPEYTHIRGRLIR